MFSCQHLPKVLRGYDKNMTTRELLRKRNESGDNVDEAFPGSAPCLSVLCYYELCRVPDSEPQIRLK
jgi:hypothetical protein